jgi:hypothetical protein
LSALLAVAAVLTLLLADTALSVGASERTTQRIGVPVIGSAASAQSIERTPRTSGAKYTTLSGVSCASAKACTAVGNNFLVSTIKYVTLAEAWHGKTWAVRATPNPPHSDSQLNGLQAVSCTAASGCTAVGSYANRTNGLTLAESWKGKTWAIVATPNPKSAEFSGLYGVSCTSAKACTAVGYYENRAGKSLNLAEVWNGKKWAIEATPIPSGAKLSELIGVSCASATTCTAVGSYTDSAGSPRTLGEEWNGKRWAIDRTPNPNGARSSQLHAVSCTSATACTAVGNYYDSAGTARALGEFWNGRKWSIERIPNPNGGAILIELSGLSCRSAKACTAVGNYWPTAYTEVTLAETWNGKKWSMEHTPNPSHAVNSDLSGVSCTSATTCVAVGNYGAITDRTLTLGEAWNGKTWAIERTPNP